MAGGLTHHRTNLDRFHPGYFGKLGMRYFHKTNNKLHNPIVNVENLWTLVPEDVRAKYANAPSKDNVPVVDTLASGYGKVLGKGVLPSYPVIVKARFFSKKAEEKIKHVGGCCVLVQ